MIMWQTAIAQKRKRKIQHRPNWKWYVGVKFNDLWLTQTYEIGVRNYHSEKFNHTSDFMSRETHIQSIFFRNKLLNFGSHQSLIVHYCLGRMLELCKKKRKYEVILKEHHLWIRVAYSGIFHRKVAAGRGSVSCDLRYHIPNTEDSPGPRRSVQTSFVFNNELLK